MFSGEFFIYEVETLHSWCPSSECGLAIQCRKLIDSNHIFLWTLLIRKRRTNFFSVAIIVVVKDWWVSKTRISPNKWKVTWKWIGPFQHDEKPSPFLDGNPNGCYNLFDIAFFNTLVWWIYAFKYARLMWDVIIHIYVICLFIHGKVVSCCKNYILLEYLLVVYPLW